MGTALPPSALMMLIDISDCTTRILSPFMSSGVLIGRALLVICRKPLSQVAR